MPKEEVHLNDVGTKFLVTIQDGGTVVDVSSASALKILFQKPDGTTNEEKAASLEGAGTDGQIKYVTVSGDMDTVGKWSIQGKVTIGTGTWYSEKASFFVHANNE